MWEIRAEQPADGPAIEALLARSFGPGRYVKTAYRLREAVRPVDGLSFVAIVDSVLHGSIRFWPVFVGAQPALLLGPLAVESELRGQGIGIALMQKGIDTARLLGRGAIILVGDLPYYARVGFARMPQGQVQFPGPVDPARILALGPQAGALDTLAGAVRRARIDEPVSADGTPWGPAP